MADEVKNIAFVPAAKYNELVREFKAFTRDALVGVGPGLSAIPLPRGRGVVLDSSIVLLDGDAKALASTMGTQDTDTYDADTDNVPVSLKVLTDVYYDTATFKLRGRYRTVVISLPGVTVSAEGDPVDIVEFVECE